MRRKPLPHMPGGEYILHQEYRTIPGKLVLFRILNRCAHVRDTLMAIDRKARLEHWHPFQKGFAECTVNRNVVCSLDLAGLAARRHQSVTRAIERRAEKKSGRGAIYPTKSRYVAPTGLRSGMYICDPATAFTILEAMKGQTAKDAYVELQEALTSCGILWFKSSPDGRLWPHCEFRAFHWPGWARDP